jgi:hypothetical protein
MCALKHTVECNDTEDEHNGQGHDHDRVDLEAGRLISVQPCSFTLASCPSSWLGRLCSLAHSHISRTVQRASSLSSHASSKA